MAVRSFRLAEEQVDFINQALGKVPKKIESRARGMDHAIFQITLQEKEGASADEQGSSGESLPRKLIFRAYEGDEFDLKAFNREMALVDIVAQKGLHPKIVAFHRKGWVLMEEAKHAVFPDTDRVAVLLRELHIALAPARSLAVDDVSVQKRWSRVVSWIRFIDSKVSDYAPTFMKTLRAVSQIMLLKISEIEERATLIHGDAMDANLCTGEEGSLWIDFSEACIDAPERDFVTFCLDRQLPFSEIVQLYDDFNPDAIEEDVNFMRVVYLRILTERAVRYLFKLPLKENDGEIVQRIEHHIHSDRDPFQFCFGKGASVMALNAARALRDIAANIKEFGAFEHDPVNV